MMWIWSMMWDEFILIECIDHIQSFSLLSLVRYHVHICAAVHRTIYSSCHWLLRVVRIMNEKEWTVGRCRLSSCLSDIQCCHTLFVGKGWCRNCVVIQNWCCCCMMILRRSSDRITFRFLQTIDDSRVANSKLITTSWLFSWLLIIARV